MKNWQEMVKEHGPSAYQVAWRIRIIDDDPVPTKIAKTTLQIFPITLLRINRFV